MRDVTNQRHLLVTLLNYLQQLAYLIIIDNVKIVMKIFTEICVNLFLPQNSSEKLMAAKQLFIKRVSQPLRVLKMKLYKGSFY